MDYTVFSLLGLYPVVRKWAGCTHVSVHTVLLLSKHQLGQVYITHTPICGLKATKDDSLLSSPASEEVTHFHRGTGWTGWDMHQDNPGRRPIQIQIRRISRKPEEPWNVSTTIARQDVPPYFAVSLCEASLACALFAYHLTLVVLFLSFFLSFICVMKQDCCDYSCCLSIASA